LSNEQKLTATYKKSELFRCKNVVYFISNHIYIQTPGSGREKFDLWDFQRDCLNSFEDTRFNIVLKSRQLGLSTLISAYVLWLMLFNRDRNILVVSIRREDAQKLIKKIKYAYSYLPDWMKISKPISDNVFTFELDNHSKVVASATTENMARGDALTHLFIDEAGFIDGLEDAWPSAWPSISVAGKSIVFSTPNGSDNFFYKLWSDAEVKENEFKTTKLMWDVRPDRDQAWYNRTFKTLPRKKFAQEFECDFTLSGDTVIDPEDIVYYSNFIIEEEGFFTSDRKGRYWKEPDLSHSYIIAADVARGDGEDYSSFVVMDVDADEIVADYKNKIKTDIYAEILVAAATLYNHALLVVENNNHGWAVLQRIIQMKYKNLYYADKKTLEIIEGYIDDTRSDIIAGFPTNQKTKVLIVERLEEAIRNKRYSIYSDKIIDEFRQFVWINGKATTKKGYHDDLVISLAICIFVKEFIYGKSEIKADLNRLILPLIGKETRNMETKIPGMIGFKKKDNNFNIYNSLSKADEDIRQHYWVLDKKPGAKKPVQEISYSKALPIIKI